MASGSKTDSFAAGFYLRADWSAAADVGSNASSVSVPTYWGVSGGSASSSQTRTGTTNIGGQAGNFSYNLTINNAEKRLGTVTKTITHNADGTKSVTIDTSVPVNLTLNGVYYGTRTISQTAVLDTIPRASTPTVSQSTMAAGNVVTIDTNRASSVFTHTLKWAIGNGSGTIATGVGDEYEWTIPLTLLNRIPNSTYGTIVITCETYANGTLVGTKTVNLTLTAPPSVVPSFTTVTHSEAVAAVNTQVGAYVQGNSQLATAITGAAGAYGSTITAYKIEVAGQVLNAASGTTNVISQSGTLALKGTVTDSRGRTATKTVNITVLAYQPPKINSIVYKRVDANGDDDTYGTRVRVVLNATVSSLINGSQKNSSFWKAYSKVRGAASWEQKHSATDDLTITGNVILTATYPVTQGFDFRVDVSDIFKTTLNIGLVSTGEVTMHWGSDHIGIGKFREQGGLDVRGDIYTNNNRVHNRGDVTITAGNFGETTVYPNFAMQQRVNGQDREMWTYMVGNASAQVGGFLHRQRLGEGNTFVGVQGLLMYDTGALYQYMTSYNPLNSSGADIARPIAFAMAAGYTNITQVNTKYTVTLPANRFRVAPVIMTNFDGDDVLIETSGRSASSFQLSSPTTGYIMWVAIQMMPSASAG